MSSKMKKDQLPKNLWYCRDCLWKYKDPMEWATHLVQNVHQEVARNAAVEGKWATCSDKPNILLAHSAKPFDGAPKSSSGNSFTTAFLKEVAVITWDLFQAPVNFIWLPKKPNVGIVRFSDVQSRKNVMRHSNGIFVVNTHHVFLTCAMDMSDLDWNRMIDDGLIADLASVGDVLSLT